MPSGLQRVRLEAAHLGIDRDSAPSQVKPGKALSIQNYLTGETGRIRQRGAITASAIAHGAIDRAMAGVMLGNDKALAGFVDLKGFNTAPTPDVVMDVERHVAPRAGDNGDKLASGYDPANHLRLIDLSANSVTNITDASADTRAGTIPFGKATRVGRFAYGFALGTANDIKTPTANFTIGQNDSGGYERLTYMLRWQVDAPTAIPVAYLCGPYGGQDMRFYYNKLFALGGRQPETGGGFVESNVIWYTREWSANHHNLGFSPLDDALNDPAGSFPPSGGSFWPGSVPRVGTVGSCTEGVASSASAMWFEPDGVTPRRLNLPGDEQDFGVRFAFVGRNLAVLKRRSLVFLVGGDPDTWTIRTAAQGVGCLDPRSVVEANEGVYFISQQGFMYFDGVQLHNASRGLERTLLAAALNAVGDDSAAGGFVVGERLSRDYIFLTIGRYYFSTNGSSDPAVPDVTFAGLYHIPTNSWSTFKTDLYSATDYGPQYTLRTENKMALVGHLNTYVATNLTTPENVAESSRGKDGSSNIETIWHSRVAELAMPFEKVQLQRIIVDYEWIVDETTADDATTFNPDSAVSTRPKVEVCDGAGTVLQTFYLPRGGNSGTESREVLRQRFTYSLYPNIPEVQVRIEYAQSNTATALVACSVLDVFIEYQTAFERRN